jgi:hypothetical protein
MQYRYFRLPMILCKLAARHLKSEVYGVIEGVALCAPYQIGRCFLLYLPTFPKDIEWCRMHTGGHSQSHIDASVESLANASSNDQV